MANHQPGYKQVVSLACGERMHQVGGVCMHGKLLTTTPPPKTTHNPHTMHTLDRQGLYVHGDELCHVWCMGVMTTVS